MADAMRLLQTGEIYVLPSAKQECRHEASAEACRRCAAFAGVRFVKAEAYDKAIPLLKTLDGRYPKEPEVLNWLGYTHRKLKDYPNAKRYYDAALDVEPTCRPALEYQGMWYVETGDIAAARANLAKLMVICASCEETQDLADALKKAGH
jgi:tetratricopeptide (TPR) repeat protein